MHDRTTRFHDRRAHVSAVTALAGIVMLLLPALAYMQYQWLGQLSQAERERMQRTLRTAAAQFAVEFDNELSKALAGLQVEGAVAREENWSAYAQRYSAWAETATEPKIIRDVLLVDTMPGSLAPGLVPPPPPPPPPPASGLLPTPKPPGPTVMFETQVPTPLSRQVKPEQLRLRRWNASAMKFEPMEWTPDLLGFREGLANRFVGIQVERTRQTGPPGRGREVSFALSSGDDNTLVSPVTQFEIPPDRQSPPKITILGFTLVRLDTTVIKDALLTSLAARHFHGDLPGGARIDRLHDVEMDYRVAVVSRTDRWQLIWESEKDAASTIGIDPDVTQDFFAARPDQMFVFTRGGDRPAPNAPVRTENIVVSVMDGHEQTGAGGTRVITRGSRGPMGPFEGRWTLLAKHRSGSLEAAVAAVRMRNLVLSSGILLLLTVSVGLIVVSSRRAQELARQQMEFVAAVSHELRTPVSVIGAAAGNLADGVVGDPQRVRKYGETIQGEARRLGETVERVLQLAGIAAGHAAAAVVPVCPAELVSDSIGACRPEIDAAGFEIEADIPMDLPLVVGDVTALRSAIQNLISNAVKYGGDARWIKVSASASAGAKPVVTISVEDRGLGIDADDRKHIFEPFYRGREAVSRQISGSGLGLNLVQRITDAHGGRVSVSSEAGKGSTFSITLPAVTDAAAAAAVSTAAAIARS